MTYIGKVTISQGDLRITADHAVVFFDANRKPKRIEATGKPVIVNKLVKNKNAALRASKVIYRTGSNTLALKGAVEFEWGEDTIKGEHMEYMLNENRVRLEKQLTPIRAWLHSRPETEPKTKPDKEHVEAINEDNQ